MDIEYLDTATPAEEGAFLHLEHPAHGHKLYTGEGTSKIGELVDADLPHEAVGIYVRGWHSDSVQAVILQYERDSMEKKPSSFTQHKNVGRKIAKALIVKFQGITTNGEPLKADEGGIAALLDKSPRLEAQIIRFAKDDANFFTDAPNG